MIRVIYLFCILLASPLVGCGLGYYLHLFKGQINIATSTVDVKDLRVSTHDTSIVKKLVVVDSLLVFANELGLHTENNYQSYFDTKGQPVSWNVSASPPDTFKSYLWKFPIVGTLPYKGFFNKPRAQSEYFRLKTLNYDVHLSPVSAYSTLGYFSDPLLSTMMSLDIGNLSELLLHELTHSTIYIDDKADFNESLASFVGEKGAEKFLERQFGPNSEHFKNLVDSRVDSKQFRLFMENLVGRLDSLYSTESSLQVLMLKRQLIFDEEKVRFSKTLDSYSNKRYKAFLDWNLNNARLLSYRRYNSGVSNFQSVYDDCDQSIAKMITLVVKCSKTKATVDCINETFNFDP
ncbi:MAG: aminopeptidase [Candidatus Latescibacterota bacterium]|nr:aminopeptidase [Candidatus Latescibacterota bacterium]